MPAMSHGASNFRIPFLLIIVIIIVAFCVDFSSHDDSATKEEFDNNLEQELISDNLLKFRDKRHYSIPKSNKIHYEGHSKNAHKIKIRRPKAILSSSEEKYVDRKRTTPKLQSMLTVPKIGHIKAVLTEKRQTSNFYADTRRDEEVINFVNIFVFLKLGSHTRTESLRESGRSRETVRWCLRKL